jgi:tryptophan-rich sensory protein
MYHSVCVCCVLRSKCLQFAFAAVSVAWFKLLGRPRLYHFEYFFLFVGIFFLLLGDGGGMMDESCRGEKEIRR